MARKKVTKKTVAKPKPTDRQKARFTATFGGELGHDGTISVSNIEGEINHKDIAMLWEHANAIYLGLMDYSHYAKNPILTLTWECEQPL